MADTDVSTDEAILDSIGEGASLDESTTEETTADDNQETQDVSPETQQADSGQSSDDGTRDESQTQQTRGPQDLVDKEGNVVARGGKERRFYEQLQVQKQQNSTLSQQVNQMQGQLEAINGAGTLGTQYDLSPEEVTTGAQLIKSFKDDPVNTVKYLLTQAQAAGHNIEDIGAGGADMSAIKQMITEAISPLAAEQQERVATEQNRQEAVEVYNGFMSKFPDANVHEDSLARLLESDQSLTPEAAYFKLKSFYLEKNLDWNTPLETLAQQEQQQQQAPEVNAQQTLPSGGNIPGQNVTDTADIADVGTSYDDIVRQSMRDAGIQI
jgi:hypothetical protein